MIVLIILYILIAACAVFGLVFLTAMHNDRRDWFGLEFWPAVLCGIFWPIGTPIYAAYILAKLYADARK